MVLAARIKRLLTNHHSLVVTPDDVANVMVDGIDLGPVRTQRAKWHVVIIDDSYTHLTQLRIILNKISGCHISTVALADDSTVHIIPESVDLIIIDQDMPQITGIQFVRRIRARPGLSSTPVMMLTGSADIRTRISAQEAGVTCFQTKPIVPSAFRNSVQRMLDQSSSQKPSPSG